MSKVTAWHIGIGTPGCPAAAHTLQVGQPTTTLPAVPLSTSATPPRGAALCHSHLLSMQLLHQAVKENINLNRGRVLRCCSQMTNIRNW